MPLWQQMRIRGRAALMASGLAWVERAGLAARAMPELRWLGQFVPRGCLAVDVGANMGIVASAIARHAGEVMAFEPNPIAFHVLARLRGARVRPIWSAVGDQIGALDLVVPVGRRGVSTNGAHLPDSRPHGATLQIPVPVTRLDALDLATLGFVKIDVEGHEAAVLAGAGATIRRCRPVLMVEHEQCHAGADFGGLFSTIIAEAYEGMFYYRGTLLPLCRFDPSCHQLRGADKADGSYVSNFFFLPR